MPAHLPVRCCSYRFQDACDRDDEPRRSSLIGGGGGGGRWGQQRLIAKQKPTVCSMFVTRNRLNRLSPSVRGGAGLRCSPAGSPPQTVLCYQKASVLAISVSGQLMVGTTEVSWWRTCLNEMGG